METWLPISGFPGYEVSNFGLVRSTDRIVFRKGKEMRLRGKVLKPRALEKGHLYVNLRKENKAYSLYVHRLVAIAFLGPPNGARKCVAHWDGDPSNNHVSNLRWATIAENNRDSIRLGRNVRPSGELSPVAKLTEALIWSAQIRIENGESIRAVAKSIGVSHTTLSSALSRKTYR